jgi:hypothetical protein
VAHPYAVDTASGTEAAPGRKDPRKLRDFVAAVRGAGTPAFPEQLRPEAAGAATIGQPA